MPRVTASRVIKAPVAKVWGAIRDFESHSRWIEHNPEIAVTGGTGLTIGTKRRVTYGDGSFFDEILTTQDDRRFYQEYDVVGELPLPVYNVRGAMKLHPVTADDTTLVVRTLTYDTPLQPGEAKDFEKSRYDLLATSLDLLADIFE